MSSSPSPLTWCPTCQENCLDHATICTVCGSPLESPPNPQEEAPQPPPVRANPIRRELDSLQAATEEVSALLPQLNERVQEAQDLVSSMTGDLQVIHEQLSLAVQLLRQNSGRWETIPPEILDPLQQLDTHRSRPTSKKVLEELPRIQLTETSALLHHAVVQVRPVSPTSALQKSSETTPAAASPTDTTTTTTALEFQAILGEFGPPPPHHVRHSVLVVAEAPRTGKGGVLNQETRGVMKHHVQSSRSRVILYMERGDGVTFCQKALLAQQNGASAVIVGNNTSAPWPYIMKDTKGEAAACGLKIPVVMISQSDGQKLVSLWEDCSRNADKSQQEQTMLEVSLDIESKTDDCVVCCETFGVSQTVLRLPACGHVYHEECALTWLKKHNACPTCRRELPTDDPEYERERRRTERTHAGTSTSSSEEEGSHSAPAAQFYG